jgi:hypothetical protein
MGECKVPIKLPAQFRNERLQGVRRESGFIT